MSIFNGQNDFKLSNSGPKPSTYAKNTSFVNTINSSIYKTVNNNIGVKYHTNMLIKHLSFRSISFFIVAKQNLQSPILR